MTEYLGFLRAVNVGGRKAPMAQVRAALTDLGLEDIGSYINSGNVYFRAPRAARRAVAEPIEARLAAELGFEVPVAVRTVAEVEAIVEADPFAGVDVDEHTRLCVAFAVDAPAAGLAPPLASDKGDVEVLAVRGHDAFVVLRQQPGRPVNAGPFLERTLGVPSTTRFFHTTAKIVAAARTGLAR